MLAAVAAFTGASFSSVAVAVQQVTRAAEVSNRAARVSPPPLTNLSSAQRAGIPMLELVNAERARRGLGTFQWHPQVAQAAEAHAADMAGRRRMSHTGSDGSNAGRRLVRAGFSPSGWGETVGAGFYSAEPLFLGWMNSTGHRNILLGEFDHVGIAAVTDRDGVPYWALVTASQ